MVDTKKAIQSLYTGLCDVYEYQAVKDLVTKLTNQSEVKVVSGQACRLSFKTIQATTEASGASVPKQSTKLFMGSAVQIKAGSKIVVTQNGRTTAYKNAGEPALYTNHQEIVLELFEKWT